MNTEINALKQQTLDSMLRYMEYFIEDEETPPYTEADVEECNRLLTAFINDAETSTHKKDTDWITERVKTLVLALNEFNEAHDCSIIETDQREDLCALIDAVMQAAGHDVNEDITEEWREW